MIPEPPNNKPALIFLALAALFVSMALVLMISGCQTDPTLGGKFPYPGQLRDADGNLVAPPSWTNFPGTWTNSAPTNAPAPATVAQ